MKQLKEILEGIFDVDDNIKNVTPWGKLLEDSYKKGELDKLLKNEIMKRAVKATDAMLSNKNIINKKALLIGKIEPDEESYYIDKFDAIFVNCDKKSTAYIDFRHTGWREAIVVNFNLHECLYSYEAAMLEGVIYHDIYVIEDEDELVRAIRQKIIELDK